MAKRIVVVDDALFMRNLLKDALVKAGYEVCGEASNALEGVEKYKELRPDLITFDIVMPKMEEIDGITAVREIVHFDPSAKIIVISALGERKLVQQTLLCGAKDFIAKPFTVEKLLTAVRKVLGD